MLGLNLNGLSYCFNDQILWVEVLNIDFNFVQVTINECSEIETILLEFCSDSNTKSASIDSRKF